MTNKEYQKLALRTWHNNEPNFNDDLHMVFGMVTEASEIADVYKKHVAYGKDLDFVNIKEELGDLMWFIHVYCHLHDFDIEEIMTINIEKLKARYPDKFSVEKALNRDLEAERKILESNN